MTDAQILDWLIAHGFIRVTEKRGEFRKLKGAISVSVLPETEDVREAVRSLVEMNR